MAAAGTVTVHGDSEQWSRGGCAGDCPRPVCVTMARSFVRACVTGLDFAEAARTSDAQTGASLLGGKLHAGPVIVLRRLET